MFSSSKILSSKMQFFWTTISGIAHTLLWSIKYYNNILFWWHSSYVKHRWCLREQANHTEADLDDLASLCRLLNLNFRKESSISSRYALLTVNSYLADSRSMTLQCQLHDRSLGTIKVGSKAFYLEKLLIRYVKHPHLLHVNFHSFLASTHDPQAD